MAIRSLAAVLISALLAGCGGGSASSEVAPVTTGSRLFVADSGNGAIGSSANSNPAAGTLATERRIAGTNTLLDTNLFDIVLDAANDRLYVADQRSILVFANASLASGNIAPARTLSTLPGLAGGFDGGLALDATRNILYAGTNFLTATQTIRVFDNASTANGATPARTLTFATSNIADIVVDPTRDILYVYNADAAGSLRISVFDGASTLNSSVSGTLSPNRTVALNVSRIVGPIGMFLDAASDRLYAPIGGQVLVFDNAHLANGSLGTTVSASRTISLPVPDFSAIAVDLTANRLYAADAAGLSIIANASTASGTPAATTRMLAPSGAAFQALAVKP